VATRTLLAYKSIITENTTLVLSTDSDLFKFLRGMAPNGQVISSQPPVTTGDVTR
jgi:modulator of FtsH protease HflC